MFAPRLKKCVCVWVGGGSPLVFVQDASGWGGFSVLKRITFFLFARDICVVSCLVSFYDSNLSLFVQFLPPAGAPEALGSWHPQAPQGGFGGASPGTTRGSFRCHYGQDFDTAFLQVGVGPLSVSWFSWFLVVFLGLPAGFPALPASF